ncbi:Aldehyde/histidinol dehydrogenase [Parasitella parasitica]|nr:Aldehyde/histidinol dehydrogenase [Parasitella parasitica]
MYTHTVEIPSIVSSLRETFQTGLTKSKDYRRQQLKSLLRLMREKQDEIIRVVEKDLHKHRVEVISAEIAPVVNEIEYMLENLDRFTKTKTVKAHYKMNAMDKCTIRKEPKGVVLIIGAWNYPINLLLLPLVGAIAAGNCAIIKPSEVAGHTAEYIASIMPTYLDPRSFTVVQGGVEETTALLAEQFDHIFYTGNGEVGKIVMTAAAKHLTPVTLELGGKSPVIIAPDANIYTAASRIMWAKLYNGGQTCIAPDYVLIPKNQMNEFIDACRRIVKQRYGDNPQESNSYCRIISQRRFDTLQGYLDGIDPKKIVVGGEFDRSDLYIAPTVVAPVASAGHPLLDKEIFGPILPLVPVEDVEESVRIVNSKDTPLALYIFTDDKTTREKILDSTQSGSVVVNDLLLQAQEHCMPFGGVGPSGMGSYHGIKSFETFTHERSTMIKTSGLENIMMARYPPYSESKSVLVSLLTLGLPEGFFSKVKAVIKAVGSAQNVFFSKPESQQHESKL